MNDKELRAEIVRLTKLLGNAAKLAVRQNVLIDKLTTAHLRVQHLLSKLRGQK